MWMYALTLMPYVAIACSLTLVATVIGIVYSQPACLRAAGFTA
jgi:hypothetical protein